MPAVSNIDPDLLKSRVNAALPGPNYVTHKVAPDNNLNLHAWEKYADIFSPDDPSLLQQLQWGFPTGVSQESILAVPFTNHSSARKHPKIVGEYINKHLHTKALYGPFSCNPLDIDIIVSPLQVAFSQSGKPRVCNDLSYGEHSVNSAISGVWSEYPGYDGDFSLPNADTVVQAILDIGPGARLWKTDFSAYYKQLSTDMAQINMLAFVYDNKLYFESRLPFGMRSSCLNAQRVTNAAIKVFKAKSNSFATGYVDDILGVSHVVVAEKDYDLFCSVTEELGLEKTLAKCVPPITCVIWIGLQFDTIAMCLSIPMEKMNRIVALLESWLENTRATKTALQSLLGSLNHVASVVIVGRAFTGHIMDMIKSQEFPTCVTPEFRQDVQFWLTFLKDQNLCNAAFKSPRAIPCDSILQISVYDKKFAVKIADAVGCFEIEDDLPIDQCVSVTFACWMATMMICNNVRGQWLTVYLPTVKAVHTINRARAVLNQLRPMVRQTWWIQANYDFVIRAKLGQWSREIDEFLKNCDDCTFVSCKSIPAYFQC